MPIASTLTYVKNLLNGLAMPAGLSAMQAFITPPDPTVQSAFPVAYVWPGEGTESRDPARGGSLPRNTGTGTASGIKPTTHQVDIYVYWYGSATATDYEFPGIVDAAMAALRTSADPTVITDPYTSAQTQLVDVGETMTYQVLIAAIPSATNFRYQALICCTVTEFLQA